MARKALNSPGATLRGGHSELLVISLLGMLHSGAGNSCNRHAQLFRALPPDQLSDFNFFTD